MWDKGVMTAYDRLKLRALRAVAKHYGRDVRCFRMRVPWCAVDFVPLLQLDHIRAGGYGREQISGTARCYEALAHPERFQIVCGHHHQMKTSSAEERRLKGRKIGETRVVSRTQERRKARLVGEG
jgi:hypothetical protein